jgi:hypothetical protein
MDDLPPIVNKLRPFLSKELPKASSALRQHLTGLECLRYALAEARVNAHQSLLEKRRQVLWPKDKDMTELDRKTRLDGDVAVYEKNYQFLVQLEEIVRDRLELGKLLIK